MKPLTLIIALLCSSCREIQQPSLLSAIMGARPASVGIVTTDFGSAGRFVVMNQEGIVLPGGSTIHSDAVARAENGLIYIINRLNRDDIQVLTPSLAFLTTAEFSTGAGSNPHDFLRVSDSKAYITLYNRDYLLVVNPSLGVVTGTIPLAQYADADGIPEADSLYAEGSSLYVTLQRLDRNDPSGKLPPNTTSLLLEINTTADSVTGVYTFQSRNPFSRLKRITLFGQPHLVVSCPNRMGFLSAIDGGIEAFNLNTKTFVSGFLYSEIAAGGDILDMEIKNDNTGYAVILDAAFNKYIQRFDPSTGQKISLLASFPASAGTVAGLLLTPEGRLFAGDAGFSNPGIMIFDTVRADARLFPQSINVGLRPFDLIYIP